MADTQTADATNTDTTTGTSSTQQTTTSPAKDTTTSTTPPAADSKKTIASGGTEPADGKSTVQPTFGDNWRKDLAGEDDKVLKRLDRFGSPKDIVSSYLELEKKLSERPGKPTLPQNATPEQLAEYRKEIGVPESADKYDLTLPKGLVIGETEKPLVDNYLKYAHDNNLPNDVVKANLNWYLPLQQEMEVAQAEADKDYQVSQDEALRKEWGADFKANINIVSGVLSMTTEDVADQLMLGRTADGKVIGDDPRMLKLLVALGREANPVHTTPPGSGNFAGLNIQDEIKALVKMSGDKNSEYWSKDKGEQMQQRLRDLNASQERMAKKGKA